MDKEKLIELKERIVKAKSKTSELKGKQKALMDQLKKDWKCSTIKQAKNKLDKLEKDIGELEDKKEAGVEELEKVLDI